mmetsp:Transcript_62/g.107  ORF Transcript_62/g.107 Transcript_62/m.107 type:complete len:278 (-) Transcript_62:1403-2236(-)
MASSPTSRKSHLLQHPTHPEHQLISPQQSGLRNRAPPSGSHARRMQLLIVAFGLANAAALLLWAARHHAGLDAVSDTTAMVSSDPWLPDAAACRPGSCPLVVLAVAADTGAWNTVKPVLLSALAGGEPVHVAVHFSGACARLVRAGKLAVPDSRMAVVLAPEGGPQHGSGRMEAELPDFVGAPHDITIASACHDASSRQHGMAWRHSLALLIGHVGSGCSPSWTLAMLTLRLWIPQIRWAPARRRRAPPAGRWCSAAALPRLPLASWRTATPRRSRH